MIEVVPVVVGFCERDGSAHPAGIVQLKPTAVWEKSNPFVGVSVSVATPLPEGSTLRPGKGLR